MFPFDRIELRGLVITTTIGVLEQERAIAQPLQLDLSLLVNLRQAGQSDDLGDTVHYGEVTRTGCSSGWPSGWLSPCWRYPGCKRSR